MLGRKKIWFLLLSMLLVCSMLVFAGGQQEEEEKNEVRFAIAEESRGLDPVFAHRRFSEAAAHVHDPLFFMDYENNRYGALGESWEVNDDATEYTIKLREDVVFHDGTKLTSEDVKAHFDRTQLDELCCGNAYQYLASYTHTEIIDDYTLVVHFEEPWGPFSYYLTMLDVTGIPSNAGWEKNGEDMNLEPIGAGPFKFVEWIPNEHILYEKYEDYNWSPGLFDNPGPARIDKLQVRFIADAQTRVTALEAGSVDIIKGPDFNDLKRLREDPNFEIDRVPYKGMPFSFTFHTNKFPTDDVVVRKAINLSIDRERINERAFMGEREPLYSTVTPNTQFFWEGSKELIFHDPEEAKSILSDEGYTDEDGDGIREKDGKPVKLDLFVFGAKEANPSIDAAELIQDDLKKIGIDIEIHVRPWDDQSVVAMNGEHNLIGFDMPLPTPGILDIMFHSRETPREGHYGMGFSYFHDGNPSLSEKLDSILNNANSVADLNDREEYYIEAQKIVGQQYLALPVASGYEIYVRDANLKGIKYDSGRHAHFNDAYWD